jgi:hypothetical protein
MHLLRYVVKCTVTDSPLNTQTSCSKCPPSAWIPFLTHVTRELVTLLSTAVLLILLAVLRIRWSSSSLMFNLCAYAIAFK